MPVYAGQIPLSSTHVTSCAISFVLLCDVCWQHVNYCLHNILHTHFQEAQRLLMHAATMQACLSLYMRESKCMHPSYVYIAGMVRTLCCIAGLPADGSTAMPGKAIPDVQYTVLGARLLIWYGVF